jgi:hypothetical protein
LVSNVDDSLKCRFEFSSRSVMSYVISWIVCRV